MSTNAERQAAWRRRRTQEAETMRSALEAIVTKLRDSDDPIDIEIGAMAEAGLGARK